MARGLDPIWPDPPVPTPDLGGDLATKRGGDPNADGNSGANGLQTPYHDAFVPDHGNQETPNPVSGLPVHIDRYAPSGEPPPPPSLTDRTPGTIDEA